MSSLPAPVELPGLRVTVDRLVYRDASEISPDQPHCFVYFISIHNDSPVAVTLKGRKWVVSHDDGSKLVVEGDGVVGQFPTLEPGGNFSYNSQHLIGTRTAFAEGSYLLMGEDAQRYVVRIPRFDLIVPDSAD